MDSSCKPPIFVFSADDGGLEIYKSLEETELNLEGIDVLDGLYLAFDSSGCGIALKATGVKAGTLLVDIGRTHAIATEFDPVQASQFHGLLVTYLRNVGQNPSSSMKLPRLVDQCISLSAKPL